MNNPIAAWEREVDDKIQEVLRLLETEAKNDHHAISLFQALSVVMVLYFSEEYERLEQISAREMMRFVSQTNIDMPEIKRLKKLLLQ